MIKVYDLTDKDVLREMDEERTTINQRVRDLEDKIEEIMRIQKIKITR